MHRRPVNRRSPPLWAVWLVSSLLLAGICALWSLSTPVPSGPDEPAQIAKAAAVVRGQLIGEAYNFNSPWVALRIPGSFSTANYRCGYEDPRRPAEHCRPLPVDSSEILVPNYVGHYPPLYYELVGAPTLLPAWTDPVRLMRLVSALLVGIFGGLAVAIGVKWSTSRWLTLGVLAGVTPTVLYLGAVVNPSALEVAAALPLWAAAAVLMGERSERPPLVLLWVMVLCGLVEGFVRPLSPALVAGVFVLLGIINPQLCRRLLQRGWAWAGLGLLGSGLVISGLYILRAKSYMVERFPLDYRGSDGQLALMVLRHVEHWNAQMVGQYGSPNQSGPEASLLVWATVVGAMVLCALLVGRPAKSVWLVVLALLAVVAMPFALDYTHARAYGLVWQGRYGLPVAVGIPIMAGAILSAPTLRRKSGSQEQLDGLSRSGPSGAVVRHDRAAMLGGGVLLVLGTACAYLDLVRHYTVGLGSRLDIFRGPAGAWTPKPGTAQVVAASLALMFLWGAWVCLISRWSGRCGTAAPPLPATP